MQGLNGDSWKGSETKFQDKARKAKTVFTKKHEIIESASVNLNSKSELIV